MHRSRFQNVHVKAGAAEYGVRIYGAILNYYNFILSGNIGYPYAAAMPANSILAQRDAANGMAVNGNLFDVMIEGGYNGLRIEAQNGEGNNEIRGCIEGVEGVGLYMDGCSGFNVNNLHLEVNLLGAVKLVNCFVGTVGPGIIIAGTGAQGNIDLTGCNYCTLTGICTDSITIDATSFKNTISNCSYGSQGGSISDAGLDTIYSYLRSCSNIKSSILRNGVDGGENLFAGGSFEKWSSGVASIPDYWSYYGSLPGFTKTGIGLTDTTHNFSRFAAKVANSDSGHAISFRLPDGLSNQWVTVWAWVKIPSPGSNIYLHLYYNSGASVIGGDTATIRDRFVKIQCSFFIDQSYSRIDAVMYPASTTTFYVADAGYVIGPNPPGKYGPPASVQTENIINGRKVTYAGAIPTTGNYEKGDIVFNNAPNAGGFAGWICVTSGAPGTWKTFGSIAP